MRKIIELTISHRGGTNSTSFSGRSDGEKVRSVLKLDKKDSDNTNYQIVIPKDTTSFNPSFFLGLFFMSIETLGSVEQFDEKYEINLDNMSSELRNVILQNISECKRKATNELEDITGLD